MFAYPYTLRRELPAATKGRCIGVPGEGLFRDYGQAADAVLEGWRDAVEGEVVIQVFLVDGAEVLFALHGVFGSLKDNAHDMFLVLYLRRA